jgi:hypothetical protein
MSLLEIFRTELCSHPISWGTRLFLAALIISAISAVIALAISTADSGNGKDNSDAPRP